MGKWNKADLLVRTKGLRSCDCRGLVLAAAAASAVAVGWAGGPSARAATYYWDADGATSAGTGGAGVWDITTPLWPLNAPATGTLTTWPNTAPNADTANFSGTTGTVTLNSNSDNINVNQIVFGTTGYTVAAPAAGTATLVLSGTTPTIDT